MYKTFYAVCHSDIHVCICMHACMHPHTHTHTNTHTHTHTETHTRTCTHTHTHVHTYNLHKWKQAVAGMLSSYPLVVLSALAGSQKQCPETDPEII